MIRINLLDWRADLREQRRKQYLVMLGAGVAASLALVGAGYFLLQGAITNQQDRNGYLKNQIVETDQKIKEIKELEKVKASLLARMKVIQNLQSSRGAVVKFFDDLVTSTPQGITLTLVKQTGAEVRIEGIGESNGRISAYMKALDDTESFAEPALIVIKTSEKDKQRQGAFTLKLRYEGATPTEPEPPPAVEQGTAGSRMLDNLGAAPLPPAAGTSPAPTTAPTASQPAAAAPTTGLAGTAADAKAKVEQAAAQKAQNMKARTATSAEKAEKSGDAQ